ncbi:MAG: FAD:protein FMN transferase [Pirellulales bacterium]
MHCVLSVFLSFLLIGAGLAAHGRAEEVETLVGTTMGTIYTIRLADVPAGTMAKTIQERIDERLAEFDLAMSTYNPKSELSRFNLSTSDDWFCISPDTAKVVAFSLALAQQTDGKFDPTVGPLVNLWGFGPAKKVRRPPTDEAIVEAQKDVGYRHLAVRLDPPALKKNIPGLYVDLSAVAPGYGVDVIAELLERSGVMAFMIEIGGEVRIRGLKPDGSTWKIGIEDPDPTKTELKLIVPLEDESLATSGSYRNFFEFEGRKYSHTIDPSTGRPVEHQLATVTARAPTCMEADAYATAVSVLGPEAGYDWAAKRGLAVLMVERVEEAYRDRATPAWTTALAKP